MACDILQFVGVRERLNQIINHLISWERERYIRDFPYKRERGPDKEGAEEIL